MFHSGPSSRPLPKIVAGATILSIGPRAFSRPGTSGGATANNAGAVGRRLEGEEREMGALQLGAVVGDEALAAARVFDEAARRAARDDEPDGRHF
jgi:hypothetical protein